MAVSCAYCSSPNHVWWDCPKKPAGWKPPKAAPRLIVVDSVKGHASGDGTDDRPVQMIEQAVALVVAKRGRGRPKSIPDMRAYKAEKAKAYRARLKLAKPNEDQK